MIEILWDTMSFIMGVLGTLLLIALLPLTFAFMCIRVSWVKSEELAPILFDWEK